MVKEPTKVPQGHVTALGFPLQVLPPLLLHLMVNQPRLEEFLPEARPLMEGHPLPRQRTAKLSNKFLSVAL